MTADVWCLSRWKNVDHNIVPCLMYLVIGIDQISYSYTISTIGRVSGLIG